MFRASFAAWQVHFTYKTGKLASLTCKYDCLSVQELPRKSLRFAGVPLRDVSFRRIRVPGEMLGLRMEFIWPSARLSGSRANAMRFLELSCVIVEMRARGSGLS